MRISYDFKLVQELAWIAATAAVIAIGGELATFSPEPLLADPMAWGLALLGGAARAAVAAVIAKVSASGSFSVK